MMHFHFRNIFYSINKLTPRSTSIAYSNDDNSATVLKLVVQGRRDRQAIELPVLAALVLSGLS